MRTLALLTTLVLAGALSAHALTPAEVEHAAAGATRGLRSVTKRLASPAFGGRDNNTPESSKAQRDLIKRLRRLGPGLDASAPSDDAYRQPFVQSGQIGTNLFAVIRGRELPDEYVLVGGHYDHLGSRSNAAGDCASRRAPGTEMCPGATDNAAGTAIVLAVGKAIRKLPMAPRRSIILALWDSEEDGLLGSLYYVNHPIVPLAQTVGYVNMDLQGANLLPSLNRTSFAVGAETGGSAFSAFVAQAVADEGGLNTLPVSYIFGQLRSDYANLVDAGVPTVFFGDSSGSCYHTTGDTFDKVDMQKLQMQSRIAFRTTMALAESPTRVPFRGADPALAKFEDAVSLLDVFSRAQADLPIFPPVDQLVLQQIYADLAGVVQNGPDNFDDGAIVTTLNAALQGIDALTRLPCQKF
ncbi:MAG TPA: M28 family peptidase [Candidatus Binatia bacterium]|jgi:hypothetical protein|nr:M28 family peptidase [Candidatus Binatia bacterium]